jgi:hypothetical protein
MFATLVSAYAVERRVRMRASGGVPKLRSDAVAHGNLPERT